MERTFNNGEGLTLPEAVLALGILTENELQRIVSVGKLPSAQEMQLFCGLPVVKEIYLECGWDTSLRRRKLVDLAQKYLQKDQTEMALRSVVLAGRF